MSNLKRAIKEKFKNLCRPIYYLFITKHENELKYWKKCFQKDGGEFQNSHYEKYFLNLAEVNDLAIFQDKVIGDFGCGPRGTLTWIKNAKLKIGLDVLADLYFDHFAESLQKHDMIYVKTTEKSIPLPTHYLDYLFTFNALDHVDNLKDICSELKRILKPKGVLLASFNLNEKASKCEPQNLTEDILRTELLQDLDIIRYRITSHKSKNPYLDFINKKEHYKKNEPAVLWVKAIKK
jgi:SAM-dependent methyltransferase